MYRFGFLLVTLAMIVVPLLAHRGRALAPGVARDHTDLDPQWLSNVAASDSGIRNASRRGWHVSVLHGQVPPRSTGQTRRPGGGPGRGMSTPVRSQRWHRSRAAGTTPVRTSEVERWVGVGLRAGRVPVALTPEPQDTHEQPVGDLALVVAGEERQTVTFWDELDATTLWCTANSKRPAMSFSHRRLARRADRAMCPPSS